MSFQPWRLALALAGVGLSVQMLAGPALADHPDVVRSEPAADATVTTAPTRAQITFGTLLVPAESTLTVHGADSAAVSQGNAQVLPNDNKTIQVALRPNLQPGQYTMRWKVKSAESGDTGDGTVSFTLAAPGTPAQSAPAARPAATSQPASADHDAAASQAPAAGNAAATAQLPRSGGASPALGLWIALVGLGSIRTGRALRSRR